ncbi:MAG: glycosyltransferase [Chitinophagaceae bacterium]
MHILWLASWFPNEYEPYLGDFIERHATAVESFVPIHVIHVTQLGTKKATKSSVKSYQIGSAKVFVYSFNFRPIHISFIDKIRYNIQYQLFYKKVLKQHQQQYGKPRCIHLHVPMKAGIVGMQVAKRWKIPYFISEHASMYEPAAIDTYETRSAFFKNKSAQIFANAIAVSNVSATVAKTIQQLFSLPSIQVIHNCVDTNLFYYKPANNRVFTFIHVSSFHTQKNILKMLQAFVTLLNTHTHWKLVMVGPANSTIQNFVVENSLNKHIEFTGEIPYAKVALQLQKANAFVTFGLHENFPCAIIEALCCGLPIIASNVGGVAEALNESNGILVPSNEQQALTIALQKMLNNYQQYHPETIATKASQLYCYQTIGKQFMHWYQQYISFD